MDIGSPVFRFSGQRLTNIEVQWTEAHQWLDTMDRGSTVLKYNRLRLTSVEAHWTEAHQC